MDQKEYRKQHYKKHRERYLEKAKKWQQENKERKAAYDKARREVKGDLLRQYDRERKQLPHRKAAHRNNTRKRRMQLKQANPAWLTEYDIFLIQEIYDLAVRRTKCLNIEFHVDHIIPLRGKNVCGLHVPTNLQIVDAKTNLKKNNNFQLDD